MKKYIESLITNYENDIEEAQRELQLCARPTTPGAIRLRTKLKAYQRAKNDLESILKIA